jgi:hypothetical protein
VLHFVSVLPFAFFLFVFFGATYLRAAGLVFGCAERGGDAVVPSELCLYSLDVVKVGHHLAHTGIAETLCLFSDQ